MLEFAIQTQWLAGLTWLLSVLPILLDTALLIVLIMIYRCLKQRK